MCLRARTALKDYVDKLLETQFEALFDQCPASDPKGFLLTPQKTARATPSVVVQRPFEKDILQIHPSTTTTESPLRTYHSQNDVRSTSSAAAAAVAPAA
jgi:hypothetical protein